MLWKNKRVVINNYKEWHDELKQIIEASNADKAAMSEEDRIADEKRGRAEVTALIKQVNERRRRTLFIPRHFRRMLFEILSRELMKYTEEDPTDLIIETDNRHGVIRMEFEQLVLDNLHPASHRKLWKFLMSHADDIWATPIQKYGDQALQYTFIFDFQKEIRLK